MLSQLLAFVAGLAAGVLLTSGLLVVAIVRAGLEYGRKIVAAAEAKEAAPAPTPAISTREVESFRIVGEFEPGIEPEIVIPIHKVRSRES